jgi:hypothetical protein
LLSSKDKKIRKTAGISDRTTHDYPAFVSFNDAGEMWYKGGQKMALLLIARAGLPIVSVDIPSSWDVGHGGDAASYVDTEELGVSIFHGRCNSASQIPSIGVTTSHPLDPPDWIPSNAVGIKLSRRYCGVKVVPFGVYCMGLVARQGFLEARVKPKRLLATAQGSLHAEPSHKCDKT